MGLPKATRILAYSLVRSRTFWAPPHISAQSATVARSITRASGGQPPPWAPSTASAPTATSLRLTSQSFRVASMVGRSFTDIPVDATRKLCEVSLKRSEEHTSELQSHSDLVCRLLLEKKKAASSTPH